MPEAVMQPGKAIGTASTIDDLRKDKGIAIPKKCFGQGNNYRAGSALQSDR